MEQSLSQRMIKYSDVPNTRLIDRVPIIIRVDGCHFHSLTRNATAPFDESLIEDMQNAAIYMVSHIEGAKLAYVQSDEISVLITNFERPNIGAWFNFRVQKMASVAASLATAGFNSSGKFGKVATFDARCFNLPREEVNNYFLYRQQDATRNSIQMLAQSMFTPKELYKKNLNNIQEMMFMNGTNWNDIKCHLRRGSCIIKNKGHWTVDQNIPIFSEDTGYVNKFILVGDTSE